MGSVFKSVGNAIFGSNSNKNIPQPFAPPPPPQKEEIDDVFDYIRGVQAITVTDEKGKKRQEIRELPKTPEETQLFQLGYRLIGDSLKNLETLQKYDPGAVVDFKPLVNAFAQAGNERLGDLARVANLGDIQKITDSVRAMQNTLIDEEFRTIRRDMGEDLAHRGLDNSTFAAESNAALAKQQALARQQGDIVAQSYGEDLADQRFARNITGYDLREQGRQGSLDTARLNYDLQQQQQQDLENMRQTSLQENTNLFGLGAGLKDRNIELAVGSQAPALSQQNYQNRLSAYGAQNQAQGQYFNNQMAAFKARGPSNRDKMMGLIGTVAGSSIGGGGFGGGYNWGKQAGQSLRRGFGG